MVTATPSQVQKANYRFCCCSHNLCNANFTEAPPTADTPALRPMKTGGRDNSETGEQICKTPDQSLGYAEIQSQTISQSAARQEVKEPLQYDYIEISCEHPGHMIVPKDQKKNSDQMKY